jgi:tRNA-dihydrouridine synthase 1
MSSLTSDSAARAEAAAVSPASTPLLPDLSRVVGPMVNQSDAPFRTLCLKYGSTAAFSEMLFSSRIVKEEKYLDAYLPSCDADLLEGVCVHTKQAAPIVQICGNDPLILAAAVAKIGASMRASAVDLNLGCPQDRAREDMFGSYLLDRCHWELVFACVRAMSDAGELFKLPIFCKIRLIEGNNTVELTKEFCR